MPVSLEASNLEVYSLVIGCVSVRKQQQAIADCMARDYLSHTT
jgi:hypothetical protein